MVSSYCTFADTVKDYVGGFTSKQMIVIGILLLVAIGFGFMLGAIITYAAGVRKGRGKKKASARVLKKMQREMAEQRDLAIAEADKKTQELLAEREADSAALQETREKLEQMEKSNQEAQEQMRLMREKGVSLEKKTKIDLLTKKEIMEFASGLSDYAPVNVYARGGELPDSCRVGICTFMLVYERKNMIKLVLRLHKKTAAELKKYKLFTKAAFPKGGDWYKWILSPEVQDLSVVTAAIRIAYKYVYLTNYDEQTGDIDVEYANREEAKINEDILKYKDLPDRDFILASDECGESAAYSLYGKKEMAAYALSLAPEYRVTVTEAESDASPSTCKVDGKSFLLAYEKDGVSKMIFRASDEGFERLRAKHPRLTVSPFPKAATYQWYVTVIDESFRSNEDIEEIIKEACAHVCES